MTFLALYDPRGQAVRIASATTRDIVNRFFSVGFVEIDEATYNRLSDVVTIATLSDLPRLQQANAIIASPQVGTRIVPTNTSALDRLRDAQAQALGSLTESYLNGDITEARWYRLFVDAINAGLIASTALGVGGLQYITSEHQQQIQQDSETQIGYLNRFRRDFNQYSSAQVLDRSRLYSGAVTSRYWTAHTRQLGLPPLPAMPGVRTSCMSNCKCNWEIRQLPGVGNWDCVWRKPAMDSCEECLRRQRVFNPLEIRNFVIQPFNPNGIYR